MEHLKEKAVMDNEGDLKVNVLLAARTKLSSHTPVVGSNPTYIRYGYCELQNMQSYPMTLPAGMPVSVGHRDFHLVSTEAPFVESARCRGSCDSKSAGSARCRGSCDSKSAGSARCRGSCDSKSEGTISIRIKPDTVVASTDEKNPWPATKLIEEVKANLPNQFNVIVRAGTPLVQSNGSDSITLRPKADLVSNVSLPMSRKYPLGRSATSPDKYAFWNSGISDLIGAAISPDCTFIVTVAKQVAKVWSVAERRELLCTRGNFHNITHFEISPDSRYAYLQSDYRVNIIDLHKRKVKKYFACTELRRMRHMCFSSNGLVATASRHRITIYRLDEKMRFDVVMMSRAADSVITSIAFSPNNKTVAYCVSDQTIKLWHFNEGPESDELLLRYNSIFGPIVKQYESHPNFKSINCICYEPSNEFIIAGCNDYVKVFHRVTGELHRILKPVDRYPIDRGAVISVSSIANLIAVAYSRGYVQLWQHWEGLSGPARPTGPIESRQKCVYSRYVDSDLVSVSLKRNNIAIFCVVATRGGQIEIITL